MRNPGFEKVEKGESYIHNALLPTGSPITIIARTIDNQFLGKYYDTNRRLRFVYFSTYNNSRMGNGIVFHWCGNLDEMIAEFSRWNPKGMYNPFIEALKNE